MCAIAGFVGLDGSGSTVSKMLASMKRRGPDDIGCYSCENCTLLHARLAVIDIAGGKQPMGVTWAGEQYEIVYNGELYNTQDLRRELLDLGHRFLGHSDTEVVLHSYAQWGEECGRC